jgi:hypothetical protein
MRRSWRGFASLVAVLALGVVTACKGLLDVSVPSRIPATPLETPANAVLLANGAIADLDCAIGSYAVVAGELTDELEDATLTAARWVYDQRHVPSDQQRYAVNECDAGGTYIPVNRARGSADNVLRLLNGATDADMPTGVRRDSLVAIMAAYAGYSRVLLGEMFCSAVISNVNPDGSIEYGPELTSQQVLQSADSMFTIAIQAAQATGNADALNMAYIGRARARLGLGSYSEASADAKQVTDAAYMHVATASTATGRRENRVYDESNVTTGVASSVGPRYQQMTYNGKADSRVRAVATGKTSSTGVVLWAQQKYLDASSPIPIAKWAEARLIVAEAAARGNILPDAIAIINDLHQRAGIDPYNGAVTQSAVLAQVIEERSRELWLEGQRLGDVRRNDLRLQPAPGTPYRNGGVYGADGKDLCLKLPDVERQNNPKLQ